MGGHFSQRGISTQKRRSGGRKVEECIAIWSLASVKGMWEAIMRNKLSKVDWVLSFVLTLTFRLISMYLVHE